MKAENSKKKHNSWIWHKPKLFRMNKKHVKNIKHKIKNEESKRKKVKQAI